MRAYLVALMLVGVSVAQGSIIAGETAIVGPSAVGPGLIAKGGSIVTSGVVGAPHGLVSPGYVASRVVAPAVGLGYAGVAPLGLGLGYGVGVGRLGLGLGFGLGHGYGYGLYH